MTDPLLTPLSPAAQRVQAALSAHGLDIQVRELMVSTRTAQEAAQAVGCSVGQIVKSLVFRGQRSGQAVLILTSGANRVDLPLAAAQIGEPLEKATADFVREVTGFAIGGVPPLGHVTPMATYMDEDLLQYPTVWAAAGTPNAIFPIAPADLQRVAQAQVIRVKGS
ncbi:YbaK/EbsC family protein [uncultured Thermanaerothrix sp.]|uniref:YbaK/EbsC family protein n=1 Tax=uncultured Thermanaerothrix sp. TaxID=1195149 RepID=UPI0026260441|nr:YbaK/EbsC family protein [uncultured Thermanaerothrix sp.]